MRGLLSLVSLLLVLVIVGLLAKHHLGAPGGRAAGTTASDVLSGAAPRVDTPRQGQQLQKQVQDDVNRLMQGRASDLEQPTEPQP